MTRTATPRRAIPRLALAALVACAPRGDAPGPVTTDSAGVSIVSSAAQAWPAATGWRIDPAPSLDIGVESGEEPYQLNRVFDAMRLPDGSVLVGNSGSSEIRVYGADGRYRRAIGRRGNGPGEFSELSSVRFNRLPDGTIVAYDGGNLRVHHFDSSGTYLRTVRIGSTPDGLRAFYQGAFDDGTWLTLALNPELRNEPGMYLLSSQQFMRYSAEGGPLNSLRAVQGRVRFVLQHGSSVTFPFVPFTHEPIARAVGQRLVVVPSGEPAFEEMDADGRLVRIVRLSVDLERTADAYPRYRQASLASMDSAQRARYEHFYGLPHALPEYVPAFQGILADDERNLWLERYRMPGETASRWEVVTAEGAWLGQVPAPPGLRLFQVGRDFVLGRHLDSLGVERVRIHRLLKQ